MNNEKITVQLASPERKYVKVYHDFLNNSFLSVEEQMIFIVLKSFIDFREDSGEVFPSLETICKRAKMGEKRARKNINALIKKGIAKKVQRGLTKTNLYTLADYPTMWECETVEDMEEVVENQGVRPLTAAEHIAELEKMGYKVEIKEKEPVSVRQNDSQGISIVQKEEPESDEQSETQDINNVQKEKELVSEPTKAHQQALKKLTKLTKYLETNGTTNSVKSQVPERYTIEKIRNIFDYDIIISDRPSYQREIDAVMNILHTTLNTTKPTIRIAGEDKPSEVVIGKLMKLTFNEIMYCIDKYLEQTERIKNPKSYMLTLLYNAKEQLELDLTNEVKHDMANWSGREDTNDTDTYRKIEKAARNEEYISMTDRGMEQLASGRGQEHELIELEEDGEKTWHPPESRKKQ
jgi:hypothetical protein